MKFAWWIKHWPDAPTLAQHLARHQPPSWCRAVVVHHTYRPTLDQWRGRTSMESLGRFYRDTRGWHAGPHLFLSAGAPDRANDGIWQGTPLNLPGVHARQANAFAIGVEAVGDYTQSPWSFNMRTLVVSTIGELLEWLRLPATNQTIFSHREFSATSCPGDAIRIPDVIRDVQTYMSLTPPVSPPPTGYTELSWLRPFVAPATDFACRVMQRCAAAGSPYAAEPDQPLLRIIGRMIELCGVADIDPHLAVAQMLHETGNLTSFWSARPQRNPAGIGVTGQHQAEAPDDSDGWSFNTQRNRWEVGIAFPTWDYAIEAHIGRLAAYTVPLDERRGRVGTMIDDALKWRDLPAQLHASVRRLKDLDGKWAVGTGYGSRIAAVAREIA